jgi:hypothetical protein
MDQTRLIRIAFLSIAVAAILGLGAFQRSPQEGGAGSDPSGEEESEGARFSRRSARASLLALARAESDFRGCDGGNERVADFWTAEIAGLFTMTSASLERSAPPEVDAPANDPEGCHLSDFWTAEVRGPYTMDGALPDPPDSAIKLIEVSVASADADEESPD